MAVKEGLGFHVRSHVHVHLACVHMVFSETSKHHYFLQNYGFILVFVPYHICLGSPYRNHGVLVLLKHCTPYRFMFDNIGSCSIVAYQDSIYFG